MIYHPVLRLRLHLGSDTVTVIASYRINVCATLLDNHLYARYRYVCSETSEALLWGSIERAQVFLHINNNIRMSHAALYNCGVHNVPWSGSVTKRVQTNCVSAYQTNRRAYSTSPIPCNFIGMSWLHHCVRLQFQFNAIVMRACDVWSADHSCGFGSNSNTAIEIQSLTLRKVISVWNVRMERMI